MSGKTETEGVNDQSADVKPDGGKQTVQTPQQEAEYQQQAASAMYGESISDIISRPDTKPVLVQTVAVFAALGVGFGLFGYFSVDALVGAEGQDTFAMFGGTIAALIIVFIASLAGPIVSIPASIRTDEMLSYLQDNLSYATAAAGAAAGQLVLLIITIFLVLNPIPAEMEMGFGDFTNLIMLSVVVTAIVAAATMYALRSLDEPVPPEQ